MPKFTKFTLIVKDFFVCCPVMLSYRTGGLINSSGYTT